MSESAVTKREAPSTIQAFMKQDFVQNRLNAVLKDKADAFASSLITLTSIDANLAKCQPQDVYTEALKAAILDLTLEKSFGYAYLIAYNERDKGMTPHFQMGYKGWIQLAKRSGLYKKMNAVIIKKGELQSYDLLREDFEFKFEQDVEKRSKLPAAGFVFYFKELNGFEKIVYMTKDECIAHGKKYSKSFDRKNGLWQLDPDKMCLKTVVLQGLTKWGTVSTKLQMQEEFKNAIESDDDLSLNDDEPQLYPENEVKLPQKEKPEAKNEPPKKTEISGGSIDEPAPEMGDEEYPPAGAYEEEVMAKQPRDRQPSQQQSRQPQPQQNTTERKPVFDFEKK